jgi:hypothetical protein
VSLQKSGIIGKLISLQIMIYHEQAWHNKVWEMGQF